MKHENVVKICFGNHDECTLNLDSPNLDTLVEKIVANKEIDLENIRCETSVEDFDKRSFAELIKVTISQLQEELKSEMHRYEEVLGSIIADPTVEEFYQTHFKANSST